MLWYPIQQEPLYMWMIGLMFFPELDILLQTWKKKEYTQFLKHYLERESLITKKYSCCNCLNNSYIKQKSSPFTDCFSWAVNGIWTHDLFLTKEVLYPWVVIVTIWFIVVLCDIIIFIFIWVRKWVFKIINMPICQIIIKLKLSVLVVSL